MPRKLVSAVIVLGVLAVACGTRTPPPVGFGSGQQFIPQVVDFLDNAGLFPSVAVDAQGTPYVTYFAFLPELANGEIAPVRPIGSPSLPGVLMASVKDGIWTRGAVAMQASIPNVSVAFGPAEVPEMKSVTPVNVNGTALAIDGAGGFHVAWVADTGLWYAASSGTSFTATQVHGLRPPVKTAGPMGAPGVAVTASGTPWVGYTLATASGQQVTAASEVGGSWKSEVLVTIRRTAAGAAPFRTAVGLTGSDQPIVAYSAGTKVEVAILGGGDEGGWGVETVEPGTDGYGLSTATGKDGQMYVAYYGGPQVHVATSKDGINWDVRTVATVSSGSNQTGRSTGVAVADDGTVYVTWYDPGTDSVRLATASATSGATFKQIPLTSTTGGAMPSVAVTPDGSAVYVAWYAETNQDLLLGTYGDVGGLSLAVRSPTPTGAPTVAPPTTTCTKPASGDVIDLVAQGIAFDTGCIQPSANTAWTIHFDNKDTATTHNVSIYPSSTQLTSPIEQGKIITGPATTDYQVPALKPGTYYFQCDVHPTQMNGQVTVK